MREIESRKARYCAPIGKNATFRLDIVELLPFSSRLRRFSERDRLRGPSDWPACRFESSAKAKEGVKTARRDATLVRGREADLAKGKIVLNERFLHVDEFSIGGRDGEFHLEFLLLHDRVL